MVLIHETPVRLRLGAQLCMEKKQLVLNNQLVTYYEEGHGPTPIIFLHGWRSEATVWQSTIQALCALRFAQKYILYALNFPGFGTSEPPHRPFTLHDYAEIVKEFVIKLLAISHKPQAIIVGHSFGARVAVKLAAQNPELIQKLILVDCGKTHGQSAQRTAQSVLVTLAKPFFKPGFMQPLRKKIYEWLGAEDYIATPELKETYLNIIREPLEPLFPQITVPTLIIWGEKDTTVPLTYGKKIHRAICASRFAVIKNAGHFPFLDDPATFLNLLKSDFDNSD